jgi:hypothetical protein
MYIDLVELIVFAICVAFIFNEGMWGAALIFFNVLFAAVVAVNFFEPLATWLDGLAPSFTYFWDFISVWAVFALTLLITRLATDFTSRHRVKFKKLVDLIGGLAFAAATGWVIKLFIGFTLVMAPLGPNILGSPYPSGPEKVSIWAAVSHFLSDDGPMSRPPSPSQPDLYVFDPQAFTVKYHARRQQFEKEPGYLVDTKRQVEPNATPAP